MANDITTLAIALQSKEAEASMQTFNSLLETGSKNAKNMENMRIGVDVDEALRQLTAFKQSYEDIAKTAQNIHFDLGMNMPAAITPPPVQASGIDTSALQEIKAFFEQSAEEMRRQSEALNESMEKMGAGAERAGQSIRVSGESMRVTGAAASEYAEKLREVNAAKKEMEKLDAKSEADAQAVFEADTKAAEAKRELARAQKQLADATEKYNTHAARGGGFTLEQLEQYEALQEKVKELKKAYNIAQDEADKLGQKLDVSSAKVEEARQKYEQLKAELAGMPAPVAKAGKTVDTFTQNAKHAGTTMTKMARGFNAVAFAGGAAIPGLSKAGMAISMFAYSGPYVGAAIVGLSAIAIAIKKIREQSELEAKIIHKNAEYAMKSVQSAKDYLSANETDWGRLGELSSMESLTNEQNQEATSIIERLTEAYGDLGIEIDRTTGKLYGYAEARTKADAQDRAYMLAVLEDAKKSTEADLQRTMKGAKKNSTPMAKDKEFNNIIQGAINNLNGAKSDEEKLRTLQETIERFRRVANKEETYTFTTTQTHKNSSGTPGGEWTSTTEHTLSTGYAEDIVDELESIRDAFDKAHNAKRNLEKFKVKPVEEYNQAVGKLATKLQEARSHVVEDNGVIRLKTENEAYLEQKELITEIGKKIEDVKGKINSSKDKNMTILDNGKTAGVYLNELEIERSTLLEKTLRYEQRIAEEKEKERKAAEAEKQRLEEENAKRKKAITDAIDAERQRIEMNRAGYIVNSKGDLARKKTEDELNKDRTEQISNLVSRMTEIRKKGLESMTPEDWKELFSARLELTNLQAEQIDYREQVKSANEKNNDARRYYNFDKNGAVIGKKTEEELNKERQKELEAARERVKASKAGTLERAQAQAELDRLAIEDYNARKKTDSAQMIQHAQGVQSRLMRGVEARSAEALALEARSFRRDDSEKAILKDTKEVQTDIRDTLNKVSETVTRFGEAFINLNGILQPV